MRISRIEEIKDGAGFKVRRGIHLRYSPHPHDGLGGLAIWYSNLSESYVRGVLAGLFVLATLLAFVFLPRRLRTLAGFLVVFAGIVVWWLSIPALNERHWQADVAVLPYATVKGEQVTIYNIRNCNCDQLRSIPQMPTRR